ncbi:MAG: aromatic aminobenezylarsenical efflux permease ArsG family transporter [Candidatus Omnitrophota bacterium]
MIPILSALWLGILTSISPCPLATNIAAISFLSKKIEHPKLVIMAGLAYTLGRMFVYAALGALIMASIVNVPVIANFLQKYMNRILGPLLIVTGLFLLGLIKITIPAFSLSHEKHVALAEAGLGGAFILGALFALAFCPISAALFFGSLISLSLNSGHGILLPCIYGIGTGLPVVIFSVALAIGVVSLSHWFHRMGRFEFYARKVTGGVFLLTGMYYSWKYIIEVFVE